MMNTIRGVTVYKIKLHMSDLQFNIKRDVWLNHIDGNDLKLTKHINNAVTFDRKDTLRCIEEIEKLYITDQKAKRLGVYKNNTSFKIYIFNVLNCTWQTYLEFQGIDEKSYTFENYELGKHWNKL